MWPSVAKRQKCLTDDLATLMKGFGGGRCRSISLRRNGGWACAAHPVVRGRTENEEEYREVLLDYSPKIEVFDMLFERCHTKSRKRSIEQHIKYFNFRS